MKCRLEIILVLLCAVGMIAACDGTCETCYAGNGGASYCTECVSSTDAILVDVSDFNHGGGSTDDSELHGTCTDEDTIENFGYPEITSGFYADNRGKIAFQNKSICLNDCKIKLYYRSIIIRSWPTWILL
jgi:hypothetical protein